MHSKLIYRGTLTCSRHTTDTNADGVAAIRQTLVDNLLRLGLMVGVYTLDERYGLRQDGDIALDDTLDHFGHREFTTTESASLQVGIDDRGLLYPTVHLQTCRF